ncbi:MAG: glutathione S-transferase N-terminal domain-containing protein [Bradymonadia bacterium]
MRTDIHYGWPVSPYSAKTRSYLKYIKHPVKDVEPNVFTLQRTIGKAVGRAVMPTVRCRDGQWLQDSSVIIDHYESSGLYPSIRPPGITQRFASALLEVFADEWLPMVALHYRWNRSVNAKFAIDEFARYGLPLVPRFLGRIGARPIARQMQSYLPALGVTDETIPGIEATTTLVIEVLNEQLSKSAYLFGGRPSLADFSLYGPLWAHLYRDPGNAHLFVNAPALVRWMEQLTQGAESRGLFNPDDTVCATLDPLFQCVFLDQWPWIRQVCSAINGFCDEHPQALRVPRALGEAQFTIGGCVGSRKLITFTQWKAQRAVELFDPDAIGPWLSRVLGLSSDERTQQVMPAIRYPFSLVDFKPVIQSRKLS